MYSLCHCFRHFVFSVFSDSPLPGHCEPALGFCFFLVRFVPLFFSSRTFKNITYPFLSFSLCSHTSVFPLFLSFVFLSFSFLFSLSIFSLCIHHHTVNCRSSLYAWCVSKVFLSLSLRPTSRTSFKSPSFVLRFSFSSLHSACVLFACPSPFFAYSSCYSLIIRSSSV